jgi:NADH-quinone oxidoreductase subunit G
VAGYGIGVSYAGLERAPAELLAGFEPEDESPIVFLRLRKAVRKRRLAVYSLAALASSGLAKLNGVLLPTVPGDEAAVLTRLAGGLGLAGPEEAAAGALSAPGAVIMAGERLAEVPGALSALGRLAAATGARVGWVPRRAGERGALDAGALPSLLPGGRPVVDPRARAEVAQVWGVASLPGEPGRDCGQILAAAATGELDALVVAGVDPADLPDERAALAALDAAGFTVSLELRASAVTDRADVVLPVAAVAEKAGTFVNWEGRPGSFRAALHVPDVEPDLAVLGLIADEMDVHLGLPDAAAARRELAALGSWQGGRASAPSFPGRVRSGPAAGQALLATWQQLLDGGRMSDGEPFLAGTARPPVAMMSAATAAEAATSDGGKVTVATSRGAVTVGVAVRDMPDRVVWLPTRGRGCDARRELAAGHGTHVTLRSAE